MSETRTVRLGDIATIERKSVQPSMLDSATFYLGLEHIQKGGRIVDWSTVGDSQVKSSKFQFTENHILYGKLRPYLAKIASPGFSGVCSTDILPIKPGAAVDKDFLFYYLRQPHMVALANKETTGANLPRISPKALAALPIELPNIEQQKKLAEQYRLQDLINQKRERQQELLKELKTATFREMFLGKSFPNKKLFEVADTSSGATPNRSNKNFYKDGTIPWVKSGELHQELITSVSEKITDEALEKTSVQLLPAGTVLIAMYGATVGAVSQLGIEATTNQAVCAIQIKDPCITETYLKYYLRSQYNFILSQAAGGAQPNINQGIIKNLTIPIPPLEEQTKFSKLYSMFNHVKRN